jgi:predicted helicase
VPNVTGGLLEEIGRQLGIGRPSAEDLASYAYALLSCSKYQETFAEALKTPGARVPLTRDPLLWSEAVRVGSELLWLHTFGQRFSEHGDRKPKCLPLVPDLRWNTPVRQMPSKARDIRYVSKTQELIVGDGCVQGVRREVWDYSVSGMQVVKKWLGYRTRLPAGRAASSLSELDHIRISSWPEEWSNELIELLKVLTLTFRKQAELGDLLGRVLSGPLVSCQELPKPSKAMCMPPVVKNNASKNKLF